MRNRRHEQHNQHTGKAFFQSKNTNRKAEQYQQRMRQAWEEKRTPKKVDRSVEPERASQERAHEPSTGGTVLGRPSPEILRLAQLQKCMKGIIVDYLRADGTLGKEETDEKIISQAVKEAYSRRGVEPRITDALLLRDAAIASRQLHYSPEFMGKSLLGLMLAVHTEIESEYRFFSPTRSKLYQLINEQVKGISAKDKEECLQESRHFLTESVINDSLVQYENRIEELLELMPEDSYSPRLA